MVDVDADVAHPTHTCGDALQDSFQALDKSTCVFYVKNGLSMTGVETRPI